MARTTLKWNYHDADLCSVVIGPKREVTLLVHLDPVWNSGSPPFVSVRFGAISNIKAVKDYFSQFPEAPSDDAFIAEISHFEEKGKGVWVVAFDELGQIEIQSGKCTEQ